LRPEAKERNSKHTHSCEGEDLEEHLAQEQEQGGEEQQADLQKIGLVRGEVRDFANLIKQIWTATKSVQKCISNSLKRFYNQL
jgi:galactokinase/mevalonate kinase-like predicted kinase